MKILNPREIRLQNFRRLMAYLIGLESMARTLQYDINENFRGCLREIYKQYVKKSVQEKVEIENVSFAPDSLSKNVKDYYLKAESELEEKSQKGILKQLKIFLNNLDDNNDCFLLTPLTNLLRLKERKIENEILYIGLLKYVKIFEDINNIMFRLLGVNNIITRNKEMFMKKIVEEITIIENKKSKPLSSSTINNRVPRSIDNLIKLNIILDSEIDRSLEQNQIRVRRYLPDFRTVLIMYLQENKEKQKEISSLETIENDYEFVKYFFMNRDTIKECLQPALKKNLISYKQQIGDALKVNFNEWQISKK